MLTGLLIIEENKNDQDYRRSQAARNAGRGSQGRTGAVREMKTKTVTFDQDKWRLVPKEPTEEMLAIFHGCYIRGDSLELAYKLLIEVAPEGEKC